MSVKEELFCESLLLGKSLSALLAVLIYTKDHLSEAKCRGH